MQHVGKFPHKPGESKTDPREESIPPNFYEPLIRQALTDILGKSEKQSATIPQAQATAPADTVEKKRIMLQYRGGVNAQKNTLERYIKSTPPAQWL